MPWEELHLGVGDFGVVRARVQTEWHAVDAAAAVARPIPAQAPLDPGDRRPGSTVRPHARWTFPGIRVGPWPRCWK